MTQYAGAAWNQLMENESKESIAELYLASIARERGMREFAKHIIRTYAWGVGGCGEPDGGDVQDMAIKYGLLVATAYDPEKHGPNDCDLEKGDQWFEFSAALASGQPPGKEGGV